MPYSRNQLQNIYLSLPQNLKEAIFSVENAEKIYQISQRYQIPEEKVPYLASVTGHVLLSALAMEKFINALQLRLKIDRATAEKIGKDIKQEIFQPVMPTLIKVQQESSQGPASTPALHSLATPKPKNENIVDLKNQSRE